MRKQLLMGILLLLGTLCLQAGTVFAEGGKVLRLSTEPGHTGVAQHAIGGGGGGEFQQMCPPGMVAVGMGAHSGAEVDKIDYLLCKPFQSAQIEAEYATMVIKADLINLWSSFGAVKVDVNAGGSGGGYVEYFVPPGNVAIGLYGQEAHGIVNTLNLKYRSLNNMSDLFQVCPYENGCPKSSSGTPGAVAPASPYQPGPGFGSVGTWGVQNSCSGWGEFWGTCTPETNPSQSLVCEEGRVMTGIRGRSGNMVDQVQPVCTFVELVESQGCEVWGYDDLTTADPTGAYYPIILNAPKNDYDELESPQKNWDLIQKAVSWGYCNVGDAEVLVRWHGRHVFRVDTPLVLTAPAGRRLILETAAFAGYTDFVPSASFTGGDAQCAVTLNGNVELRQSDFLQKPFWIDGALHGQLIPFFSGYHSFGVSGFPVSSLCLMNDNNIVHMGWVEQGCGGTPEAAVLVQGNNNRIVDSRITQNCGHGIVVQSGQANQIVRTNWNHMLDVDTATFVKQYTPEGMQPLQTGIKAPKIALTIPDKTKPHVYRLTATQLPPAATKLELYLGTALWDAKFQSITLKYDEASKTYSAGALPGATVPRYLDFDYKGPAPYNLRHGCIDLAQGSSIDLDIDALGVKPGRQLFVTAHTVQLSAEQKKAGKSVCDADLVLDLETQGQTSTFSAPVYFASDANGNGTVDGACEGIVAGMGCVDIDKDGIVDAADNCTEKANATQGDDDGDGIGNLCDATACPAGQKFDPTADQCEDPGCEHGAPNADGTCPEAPLPPKCASPLTEKADGTCCDPDAPTDNPISCGYVPTEDHACADPGKEQWDFTTGQCVPIPGAPAQCAVGEDPDPTDPTKCIVKPKDNPTKGSGEDCAKLGQVFDANMQQCVDPAAPAGDGTTNTAVVADTTNVTNGGGTPAASTEEKKEEPKCESGLFLVCGQNTPEKKGWINGCSLMTDGPGVPVSDVIPWLLFGACISVLTLCRLRGHATSRCIKARRRNRRRAGGQRGRVAARPRRCARRGRRNGVPRIF